MTSKLVFMLGSVPAQAHSRIERTQVTLSAKFGGKRWGVLRHVHRCLRSSSRGITIQVR